MLSPAPACAITTLSMQDSETSISPPPTVEELLHREQQRVAQLESYAADLRQTYSSLRRHLQHLTVLLDASPRIASLLDPHDVLVGVLETLVQLVRYQSAQVYVFEGAVTPPGGASAGPGRAALLPRLRAACEPPAKPSVSDGGPSRIAAQRGIAAEALARNETRVHEGRHGRFELAFPLRAMGGPIGVLVLQTMAAPNDELLRVVELFAAHAAVALQNAERYEAMQRMASLDPLTSVSNYRAFYELLEMEVQRSLRLGYPLGLLILDLDHFKEINDRFGHQVGDQALRRVATLLRTQLRRTDTLGRVGGEEFAVVLPGATSREVLLVAEKLRRTIHEHSTFQAEGDEPVRFTVSVGGCSLRAEDLDRDTLVQHADTALYAAKRSGRNRAALWTPPAPKLKVENALDEAEAS